MNSEKKAFLATFWHMLKLDLHIFKKEVRDKIINVIIFSSAYTIIIAYIMPQFGLDKNFGIVMAAGLVAMAGMFELFMAVVSLTSDFHGDQIINYYLMLPAPSWIIFARMATYSAVTAGALSLAIIPLTKLLLWHQFSLTAVSWGKFLLIFLLLNYLFGAFALFLATTIKSMRFISNAWMRIVFPLQMFAGFQFTWKSLYTLSPTWAIIDLLNPFLYGFEGIRSVLLGPTDYVPYWYCVGALIIFIAFFFTLALRRLKKMLDYV